MTWSASASTGAGSIVTRSTAIRFPLPSRDVADGPSSPQLMDLDQACLRELVEPPLGRLGKPAPFRAPRLDRVEIGDHDVAAGVVEHLLHLVDDGPALRQVGRDALLGVEAVVGLAAVAAVVEDPPLGTGRDGEHVVGIDE